MLACSSPWLIAAGHVFRRRLVPLASTLCSCSLDYNHPETNLLFISSDKIATGLNNLFSRYSRPLICAVVKVHGRNFPASGDPEDDTGMEADSQFFAPLALFGTFVPSFSSIGFPR